MLTRLLSRALALGAIFVALDMRSQAATPALPCPPIVPVEVLEFGGLRALTLSDVADPHIRIPLTLRASENTDAAIESTPFLTPIGGSVVPRLTQNLVTLTPGRDAVVYLEVNLPAADTYRATIQLRVPSTAQPKSDLLFTVIVNRTRSQPQFEVFPQAPLKETICPFARLTPQLHFRLFAKHRDLTIQTAEILSYTYRVKADDASTATALDPPQPVQSFHLALPLDQPAVWTSALAPLERPGRYDATFRFSSPGYAPVDRPVTVYLRYAWYWALLSVVAGALFSLGLCYLTDWLVPLLRMQVRIDTLYKELRHLQGGAQSNPEARSLIATLTVNVDMLSAAAKRGDSNAPEILKAFELVVPAVVRQFMESTVAPGVLAQAAGLLSIYPPEQTRVTQAQGLLSGPSVAAVQPGTLPPQDARKCQARCRLFWVQFGVSLMVGVVAGLAGVKFLWLDDPTWGTWGSVLAAFLAGFASEVVAKAGLFKLWTSGLNVVKIGT